MRTKRFLILMITAMLICSIFIIPVNSEMRTVRIGYFNGCDYIDIDANGNKSGYIYEYMQELSKYGGFKCEYIMYDSWNECLKKLENGEIDVLSPTVYSEERKQNFDFCDLSMGKSFTALLADSKNTKYIENDFLSFDGIKIGAFEGSQNIEELKKFAEKNKFSYELFFYKTDEERKLALKKGEIDAIMFSSTCDFNEYKVISKFAATNYYAIVKKGNVELLDILNYSMTQLDFRNTDFQAKLYSKYYKSNYGIEILLNQVEKEYVSKNPVIRAVAMPGVPPLSYFEDGQFKGIVSDVMSILEKNLDIKFNYIETKSYEEALKMIENGEADIICSVVNDYNWSEKNKIKFTTPYIEYFSNRINNKNSSEIKTIATTKSYYFNEKYIKNQYNEDDIFYYDNEQNCVDAVLKGKQDAAYISSYLAEQIMLTNYNKLTSHTIKGVSVELAIGVFENANPILFDIIDKQIKSINKDTILDIVTTYEKNRNIHVGLYDFIYQNPIRFFIFILITFLSIICLLVYIMLIRKKHSSNIFELAYVDSLTGLWNLNYFESEAKKILNKNKDKKYAFISFDINRFTIINDCYGRNTGDNIIKHVANILKAIINDNRAMARIKSDHFIIMIDYENIWKIENVIKYLREAINQYDENGINIKLIINIGVYYIEDRNMKITSMLDFCDIARREAKIKMSRTVFFDKELEERLRFENEIENTMEDALENGDFEVYYQPKFDVFKNKIYGAEALVRWNTNNRGILSPEDFIPIFENNGFIIEVDFYVLEEVCKFVREFINDNKKVVPISVNQSRVHFSDENYIERLKNLLKKYQIPKDIIELEITETAFINTETMRDTIKDLKELGFKLSVDDFGCEYSSAIMLKNSYLDTLKIDKTFLMESQLSNRSKIIISTIVELAQKLGMEIVCEGIENIEQIEFLKTINCRFAQGYYFSVPLIKSSFKKKLEDNM